MKQKLFNSFKLRAIMLVALLCSAFMNAWAEDVVYQTALFGSQYNSQSISNYDNSWTATNEGFTVTLTNFNNNNNGWNYVKCGRKNNASVASITTAAAIDKAITQIDLTIDAITSKYVNSIKLYTSADGSTWTTAGTFGSSESGTKTLKPTSTANLFYKIEFDCASGTSNGIVTVSKVEYYTASGGDIPSDLEECDLTLTNAPVALSFDLYNNADAQTISYTSSSIGAVTVSTSDYVTTSVNESAKTITVTPVAVTPNAQTIIISQAADDTYAAGSQSFTVTIDDSTPLPTYTITLGDNNEELTEATNGAGVTLPTRDAIGDYAFAGWSTTNIETETTEIPTIIPAGAYQPSANITLFPVYTMTVGGSGTSNETISVTIKDYATANNWANGTAYQPLVMDENISVGGEVSGNNFKFYTSDNSWRFYTGGSFTITATNNATLSSVTLTFNGGTLNYGESTLQSGKPFDVSGSSAEISCTANAKITAISVDYTISGGGTTYYWSAPVAAAVERPAIEVAENPFFFSTTATITCETDGATIKYSYDGETWSDYTAALTITESTTIYAKAFKGNDESNVATTTATKKLATPTVTIAADNITNTNVFEGTAAGSLSSSVTYEDTAVEGATVTWSSNNGEVATINASTGEVTLVAAGSVTFTATYAGNSDYSEKTATYEMTVKNIDPNAPGTKNNPYTVAQACDAIDAGTGVTGVYVKGIISQIDSYNSKYSSITYWISEDGTTTNQFEVYSGKGIDGANFSSKDDIVVGASVVVYGDIKNYQGTYELNQNNQLVSYEIPSSTDPAIKLNISSIAATAEEKDGTITVTYENITEVVAEVQFCDAEGNGATYDWIDAEINDDNNVEYTIAANDGEARTAYFRVYALDDNSDDVYSAIVSVTQEAYVPDFATLPFEFNGTKSDIENTYGLTQSGLGTDYAASTAPTTQLKFDGTGDNLTLKLNEGKAVLFFDIKGNGFSGGTFTVQTSADGESYSDLATYTALGNAQTETLVLAADVRYVKWVYTEKVSGNVGLGNIIVKKDVTADVAVSSVGFATFSSVLPLDFTDVTEVYAYIAKQNGDRIQFTRVKKVPAKTGVLLRSAEGGEASVSVPVLFDDSDDVTGNIFVPALTEISKLASTEGENSNYILSKEGNNVGFYLANDKKVAAGRAYIQVPTAEGVKGFALDFDIETAINGIVNGQSLNGNCYNLSGQRVNRAQKGIFIVNGKKVVK